jgi:hypothetical protein
MILRVHLIGAISLYCNSFDKPAGRRDFMGKLARPPRTICACPHADKLAHGVSPSWHASCFNMMQVVDSHQSTSFFQLGDSEWQSPPQM